MDHQERIVMGWLGREYLGSRGNELGQLAMTLCASMGLQSKVQAVVEDSEKNTVVLSNAWALHGGGFGVWGC